MDLGTDPVDREGHEPNADRRVEALDRLHEAHVAFLDQVAQGQPVAGVAAGDVDDETQVGDDELAGRVQVFVPAQPPGQFGFPLVAQHGHRESRPDVGVQIAYRACEHEFVVASEGLGRHSVLPEARVV